MIALYEQYFQKKNAPMFIYQILYGKEPPFMRGRGGGHQERDIGGGIFVDRNIPRDAILELNKMPDIEARSSCEGSGPNNPTYFIFRPKNQDEKYVKKLVSKLNKQKDIKSGYEKGNMGFYRVGITIDLWYEKDPMSFNQWWYSLPKKIKKSL